MKTVFIAAGGIEWGSSRMRAWWVANALGKLPNDYNPHRVDVVTYQQVVDPKFTIANDCDNYIWQKTVNMTKLYYMQGRHYWDVCDPSWWWEPNDCRMIASRMTAVIASSQPLADDFNQWYGEEKAVCIPDRLDMTHFTKQRKHTDVSPVRFIWFGVAVNRMALLGAIPFLERLAANGHKIELTIMDDRPDQLMQWSNAFPIYHTKWTLDTEVEILASHDIALLPPYPGAWGKVKSNNKALTAWACGLPIYAEEDYIFLESMVSDSGYRESLADDNLYFARQDYQVAQSAGQWEAILCAS